MNENIKELRRLLYAAYDDYFKTGDGHCKSSEGAVEISHWVGDYWSDEAQWSVMVYSYVFGPHRTHHFHGATLEEASLKALTAVKGWLHSD